MTKFTCYDNDIMLTVKHVTELSSDHTKILVLHPARPKEMDQLPT